MSGYTDGETLLLAQIQALDAFDSDNSTSASDKGWRQTSSGNSANYVILRPGPFERSQAGMRTHQTMWVTWCEVWVRIGQDFGAALSTLIARVAEIVDRFDQYRKAGDTGGTVLDVFVRSADEPVDLDKKWVRWTLRIEWQEQVSVTYAE